MNAANRVLNRGVLLLTGLLLAGAGAIALLYGIRPDWARPWISWLDGAVADVTANVAALRLPLGGGAELRGIAVVLLIAAVVVLMIAVLFLFTTRRGRTHDVLRLSSARGRTVVDRNVVDALLRRPLNARHDVLAVRTAAYTVRGAPAVALAVTVRKGAPLGAVLDAADVAVRRCDEVLGARMPVLVHLQDTRWRDAWRARTRVR